MKKPKSPIPGAWNDWPGWQAYNRSFGERHLLQDGQIMGSIFIFHARGLIQPALVRFTHSVPKSLTYKTLRILAVALEAEAVGVISEAWTLSVARNPGEGEAAYLARSRQGPAPSQSERRIEALSTVLVYREDDALFSLAALDEMQRDADAKVVGLKSLISKADEKMPIPMAPTAGFYAELLEPSRPDQNAVDLAREAISMIGPKMIEETGIHLVSEPG